MHHLQHLKEQLCGFCHGSHVVSSLKALLRIRFPPRRQIIPDVAFWPGDLLLHQHRILHQPLAEQQCRYHDHLEQPHFYLVGVQQSCVVYAEAHAEPQEMQQL